jgi:hypothetical protein
VKSISEAVIGPISKDEDENLHPTNGSDVIELLFPNYSPLASAIAEEKHTPSRWAFTYGYYASGA